MARNELVAGKQTKKRYRHVDLAQIVGKTVEAVTQGTVPGNYGPEPVIYILFSDGTRHGFVLPTDED